MQYVLLLLAAYLQSPSLEMPFPTEFWLDHGNMDGFPLLSGRGLKEKMIG